MDWTLGIGVENGRLVMEGINRGGDFEACALSQAGTTGIPTCLQKTKKTGNLELSSFMAITADEYLDAFGLKIPSTAANRHGVWESSLHGMRILVPSLVLMRALFRPSTYLLPEMFNAQALDKSSFVDFSHQPPRLTIDAYWRQEGYLVRHGEIEQPLSWMTFFPSANRMAASLHQSAMRGNLGMEMPQGNARMAMRGLDLKGSLMVTEIRIISVQTEESPISEAHGHSQFIKFREITDKSASSQTVLQIPEIPARSGGALELTDHEWDSVGPLLLKGQSTTHAKLNQRHLFEAILAKINSGISWRNLESRSGNGNNAQFAHRTWNARGTFEPALEALRSFRS